MTTMIINLQANTTAWDADRPLIVAKCQVCHTCYPERDLERADMQAGVCAGCRKGALQ